MSSSAAQPLLEVQNLSVGIRRGRHCYTAVNQIGFTINTGEIVALVGESGCGKTLTALSIMRLLPLAAEITGGEIKLGTRDQGPGTRDCYTRNYIASELSPGSLNTSPHSQVPGPRSPIPNQIDLCSANEKSLCKIRGKDITMIFQEPRQSLNPLMRIGAQISEVLKLHGADKKTAEGAALEILHNLRFLQPEKIIQAWPHQLSGGMCQRVMIAIAAINRPRLIIADEPTSALDSENSGSILSLLEQINREYGTAILFISHDLSLAQRFSSRSLIMYAGSIIEEGPSETIFSKPMHPYTTALSGTIPCRESKGKPLAVIPGKAPSVEDNFRGCPFAPRCPRQQERCTSAFPPTARTGNDRKVRCFFPGAENA
ncbi:MAG: ABC transporter ATP-binding protein [Treponema sp.]|nr:ABC transporter ATP-binding protein [Treponema sp.]